jgi:hypothetical protein
MDDVVRQGIRAGLQWACRVVNGPEFTADDAGRVAKFCAFVRALTEDADDVEAFLARALAVATEELLVDLMVRHSDVDVLKGDLDADLATWRAAVEDFAQELAYGG